MGTGRTGIRRTLDKVENIEVEGSHCGLGWNTAVLAIIADRLRQAEGGWAAYNA